MSTIESLMRFRRRLSPCDVPFLGFYRTMEFHFRVAPSFKRMKTALDQIAEELPDIAGRIERGTDGEYWLVPGVSEIEFSCDEVAEDLPDYFTASRGLRQDINQSAQEFYNDPVDVGGPLVRLRLIRHRCGGARLSMQLAHALADGQGRGLLLRRWAETSRKDTSPCKIELDRGWVMAIALSQATVDTDPESLILSYADMLQRLPQHATEPTQYLVIPVPESALSSLTEVANHRNGHGITRNDVLTATLWKVFAEVQPATAEGQLCLPLDIRARPGLGIPEGYIGNALTFCYIDYSVAQVRQEPVRALAAHLRSQIGEAVTPQAVSRSYQALWKYRHLREKRLVATTEKRLRLLEEGSLFINNLARFPVRDIDFGTGHPHWVSGLRQPSIPSACIFPASYCAGAGYLVHLHLLERQMPAFIEALQTNPLFDAGSLLH